MEGYRRQTEPNVSHGASVGFNYTQTLSGLRLRLDLHLRVSSQTSSKPAPSPPTPSHPPQPLAVQHQLKHVTHMLFLSINLLILPCLPPPPSHTHTKAWLLTSYEVYTPPCFMFLANLVLRLPSPPSTLFHFVSVSLSLSLCHPSLPLSLPPSPSPPSIPLTPHTLLLSLALALCM